MADYDVRFGRAAPTVAVSDIDRALEFYCGVLGMEKTFENGDPVGFVILVRDKAQVHLTLVPGHKAKTTANVFHLIVDDADALYQHLEASGTRIVKGLRDQKYGLRDFIFADQDGNRIDVGQPMK